MLFDRLFRARAPRPVQAPAASHPAVAPQEPQAPRPATPAPACPPRPIQHTATTGPTTDAAPAEPGAVPWSLADLNDELATLRERENRLLASAQAVEAEMAAVLSEYALARTGASPEVKRRLQRRYQRLECRRSSLDQLHASQLQRYRLLDHVEADLMRRDLSASRTPGTVMGLPLGQVRAALELSTAQAGRFETEVLETIDGLDSFQQEQSLADQHALAEVEAKMNALTEAEVQHTLAHTLAGTPGWPSGAAPAEAMPLTEPGLPTGRGAGELPASHWQQRDEA